MMRMILTQNQFESELAELQARAGGPERDTIEWSGHSLAGMYPRNEGFIVHRAHGQSGRPKTHSPSGRRMAKDRPPEAKPW